jgi:hypothetical protein
MFQEVGKPGTPRRVAASADAEVDGYFGRVEVGHLNDDDAKAVGKGCQMLLHGNSLLKVIRG